MDKFSGKKIHIIGLGAKGTGRACAKVLAAHGALITISDSKEPAQLQDEIRKLAETPVRLLLGEKEAFCGIEEADLIVPSPGVPLNISPIERARKAGVPILSEVELAYRLCRAPIIAVTGTKGKTTTTTLIGLLLAAAGKKVRVGGNIGLPLIELADTIAEDEILVAELSSFQLEAVEEFRPHIAVFTNLYPDHLDRYDNMMERYFAAKLKLFVRQTAEDFAIVNQERPESMQITEMTDARVIPVSNSQRVSGGVYLENCQIISEVNGAPVPLISVDAIRLRGEHNLENVLQALAVLEVMQLSTALAAEMVLPIFRGVANRLEEVADISGVTFYNDSQGTTPIAVRMALKAFAADPPVLIAGGRAKISDFSELGQDIANSARALVLIGEAAETIASATYACKADFPIYFAKSLPEAVQMAYQIALPQGVVILSPACASFDMFINMEHRGEVFRQAVIDLQQ